MLEVPRSSRRRTYAQRQEDLAMTLRSYFVSPPPSTKRRRRSRPAACSGSHYALARNDVDGDDDARSNGLDIRVDKCLDGEVEVRATGCCSSIDDQRGAPSNTLARLTGKQRRIHRHDSVGGSSIGSRRSARDKSSIGVRAKAIVACGCLLSIGAGTVAGFSAVCSPPRPRQQQNKPQDQQQQHSQRKASGVSTPQPPLSPLPHTRRFLEDIISGQERAAATEASPPSPLQREGHEEHGPRRQNAIYSLGDCVENGPRHAAVNMSTLANSFSRTDWSSSETGAATTTLAQTTAQLEAAAAQRRTSPTGDENGEEEGKSMALVVEREGQEKARDSLAQRISRKPNLQLLSSENKKPKPKHGYRKSSNKRVQAIQDMCGELCQARLLTREEEYDLGTKIQVLMGYIEVRNRLMSHLGRVPSAEEWAEACCLPLGEFEKSMTTGREAKQAMVRANMRMVISIARKYDHLGVPLTDLIQEGSLGLVRAVEKFDPERGFKLSTYSAWWIQQAVFKGIAQQSRVIRLPVHVHNLLNSVRKAQRELTTHPGQQPSDKQVAHYLDMPLERLKRYLSMTKESISFEIPMGARTSFTTDKVLGDTLESSECKGPERESDTVLFRARLRQMVDELPDAERKIVCLRFGLDNGKAKTISQIADLVDTPRPYIRKVEGLAMRKLRSPDQQKRLREFRIEARTVVPAKKVLTPA